MIRDFTETHHAIFDMKCADIHKTAPYLCLLHKEIPTVWYQKMITEI